MLTVPERECGLSHSLPAACLPSILTTILRLFEPCADFGRHSRHFGLQAYLYRMSGRVEDFEADFPGLGEFHRQAAAALGA